MKDEMLGELTKIQDEGLLEGFVARINSEEPLSEEKFLRLAGLPEASVDLDGEISFTFGHEDLLWGHWQGVEIHPDGTVETSVSG